MEGVEILKRGYLYDKKVGILPKSVVSSSRSYANYGKVYLNFGTSYI